MKNFLTFIVIILLLTPFGLSKVWEVPGQCPTIQAGLDSCQTGDTVLVAQGTYYENLIWPATQSIYLMSESGPIVTTIDGGGIDRVIYLSNGVDAATVIKGFTIQNGYSIHGGGMICRQNSSPKITNNMFISNVADSSGGAIMCSYGSSPIIVNNIIKNNTAGWGGGIFCAYDSNPNIVGNVFLNNDCLDFGVDIFAWWGCSPNINNNQIHGNHPSSSIFLVGGFSYISNNRITNTDGTGIRLWSDFSTISYNIIDSNGVDGISCTEGSNPTINFNNIINNTGYGVNNLDPLVTVDAENNWWGDASGPGGVGPGSGDSVSLFVDYDPWLTQPVYPDTIHVPADYTTIQEAIDAAINGNVVLVDEGTYYENINYKGKAITVASHFLVDGDESHIKNTIIDGSQPSNPDSGSVVYFVSSEDTTSVLYGFTITGGTGTFLPGVLSSRVGGGIICLMSGAKITNCVIENNSVEYQMGLVAGGGIAVGPPGNTSWVILENNTIRNNSILGDGDGGGGVAILGNVKILNNVIEHNTAESIGEAIWGGGILLLTSNITTSYEWFIIGNTIRYNKAIAPSGTGPNGGVGGGLAIAGESSSVIIRNNEITYNEVQGNSPIADCHGGGVFLQNQSESCIFSENYVAHNKALENSFCKGAGISIWSFNTTVKPQLFNNLIVNNTNANIGGGIFIGGTGTYTNAPLLFNNTITQNSATFGGAVYSTQSDSSSNPLIINSILWGNGTEIYYSGGDVVVHHSNIEGGWTGTGSNNINTVPHFDDPANFDYHLRDISPCIGAGIETIDIGGTMYYCPPFCYDGNPRPNPSGSMPDIGACESPLGDPTSGIYNELSQIPVEYSLAQNYPNPFNPTTTIVYGLRERTNVELKLFDVLGSEIEIFVSGEQDAGYYEIEFNASKLASGIYFYKLQAGNFVETKKMMLLK